MHKLSKTRPKNILRGLNIVIIGAGRGIGFQVTRHLTVQNHNLFCVSRNILALANLRNELVRKKSGNKFELFLSQLHDHR